MRDFEPSALKPDNSDRPQTEASNGVDTLKSVRQYLTIGLGVIIFIVLVATIISALKSSPNQENSGSYNIDIGASKSNEQDLSTSAESQQIQPQEIEGSSIISTPTEAAPLPVDPNEKRIEIPSDVIDALDNKQQVVNSVIEQGVIPPIRPLKPVKVVTESVKPWPVQIEKPKQTLQIMDIELHEMALTKLPSENYTLQLSASSRSDLLDVFAKKHQLSQYWIYETYRLSQPWFVLITGSYDTFSSAKKAMAKLPIGVKEKQPWVKPIRQVHQELIQR